MSDDTSDDTPGGIDSLTPSNTMDEERPLDALLPEINEPDLVGDSSQVEKTAVHPRVLGVELEDGDIWALACWEDPGMHELHAQLERMMSSALLAKMVRPSGDPSLHDGQLSAMELLAFGELFPESKSVLGKLGFEQRDFVADEYVERMDAWKSEAEQLGHDIAPRPESVWRSECRRQGDEMDDKLARVHRRLDERLDGQVWGESPGGPSKFAAELIEHEFNTSIEPTPQGLSQFELILLQSPGPYLRWMRPLLFQALCDFVGVILQLHFDASVALAMCKPEDDGFIPPPLFRIERDGGWTNFDIGRWMVDLCLMPGESADSVSLASRLARKLDSL